MEGEGLARAVDDVARALQVPGNLGPYRTILRQWRAFSVFAKKHHRMAPTETWRPHPATLQRFAVWLVRAGAEDRSRGGETAVNYVFRLPRALAWLGGKTQPQFSVPGALAVFMARLSKEVPAAHPLHRVPLGLAKLRTLVQSRVTPPEVAAAAVLQFHLGCRGINLYYTDAAGGDHSRKLRWSDVTLVTEGKRIQRATVRMRKEKTARKHTGSFPDKHLVQSTMPDLVPCAVRALEAARRLAPPHSRNAPLFPHLTGRQMNDTMKKVFGQQAGVSTHSIRQGAVTEAVAAGATDRAARRKGGWARDSSADRYIVHDEVYAQEALRRLQAAQAKRRQPPGPRARRAAGGRRKRGHPPPVRAPQPAPPHEPWEVPEAPPRAARAARAGAEPGETLLHHAMVLQAPEYPHQFLLMTPQSQRVWRGYHYDCETQARCEAYSTDMKSMMPYETFNGQQEWSHLVEATVETQPATGTELEQDMHLMCSRVWRRPSAQGLGSLANFRRYTVQERPRRPKRKPARYK